MKKYYPLFLLVVFILAIACGGGGGSNSTTNTTTSTTTGGTTKAEAVLAGNPSQIIDPLNIQVGETIQFEVVHYTAANVRSVLASSNWTTTDNGASVGTLSPSGVLTASASSPGTFTATGTSGGSNFSINYLVKPIQALVSGTMLDSNGDPVSGVSIVFYTAGGTPVGRVKTASNGTFRASVPTTATKFNLDPTTMSFDKYFKSFVFSSKRYSALIATSCAAPLPPLTNGVTTPISTVTVDAAMTLGQHNPPPPPPNGCS